MKAFRKLYVWALNAKLFMAFYFMMMVIILGLVTLLVGGDSVKLLTMLEMGLVCIVIGALQAFLLNDNTDYTRGVLFGRSIVWLAVSALLSTGAALLFGWFAGGPRWSAPAFGVFILIGLMMTLTGLKFEQEADTVRLNEDLDKLKEHHR